MDLGDKLFGRLKPGYYLLLAVIVLTVLWAARQSGTPVLDIVPNLWADPRFLFFLTFPIYGWLFVVLFRLMRKGSKHPAATIKRLLRRDKWWLVRMVVLLVFVLMAGKCFSLLKGTIPLTLNFYADPALVDLERTLLGGNDAWVYTHAVFGSALATEVIDRIYTLFFPISAAFYIWMIASWDTRLQLRGLLGCVFVWVVLGYGLATLLSSSGPVFYEYHYGRTDFMPLLDRLNAISAERHLMAPEIASWLIESMGKGEFGSGVSAMPSIHVGQAFLLYLVLRYRMGWKHWISWCALAFVTVTWIGSVHLAWHYMLDGFVSIVLISAAWHFIGRFVDFLWARDDLRPQADYTPVLVPQ